jgi:ribonuclease BN (tRNA processing enzyme)
MLRLSVLGSGDAFNSGGALHSCYLLEHGGGKLMLECGPSALAGMKRSGIPTDAPDALLISHLHGDHFGGIPFLLLEYLFSNPRSRPLIIAGPPTIEQRVRSLYAELYREVHCRQVNFALEWVALEPGSRRRMAGFDVTAFEVPHSAEPLSLGYRIESNDGVVVFSGDSAWTDAFVTQTKNSDLFLCECCSMQPETPVHTSYEEILAHRAELGCRRLVLTHLGADVRSATDVTVERAHDGMVIEVSRQRTRAG